MAFDPDKYLAEQEASGFDPDKYLAKTTTTAGSFDPDRYLEAEKVATTADLIKIRRGERPAPVEEAPVVGQEMVQTAGVMPFDETSEFAGMEMQQDKEPAIRVADLSANEDYFKIITDYAKVRSDKTYNPEKQSKEEFVTDFLSDMRYNEANAIFGALPELNWMRNASPEDQAKGALARRLYQETAGVEEPGGQQGWQPYVDVLKGIASDPLNFLGLFTGKATGLALSKSTSATLPKAAIIKTTAAATEGIAGASANILDQRTEQEVAKALGEEAPELSVKQIAAAAVLSSALGYVEGVPAASATKKQKFERLAEEIKKRKEEAPVTPTSPTTGTEKILIDAVNENMDQTVKQFMEKEGKRVLDEVGGVSAISDPKVATELSARAVRVAMRVIETDPEFRLKPSQQTSDAIARVFANLETVDDAVLEQAIRAEGLTPDEFAAANKVTVSEAGRILQQYSVAARMLKKLGAADPAFAKRMEELYGKNDEYTSLFGWGVRGVRRAERESKAWITSGIDTTVRNVAGTAIGLSAKTGADLIEGTLYTLGVALRGRGVEATKKAFSNTIKDSFNTFFYLRKNGLAADVTDKLLESSPALRNHMLSALQETSKNDVSKAARLFNSLNAAQDIFFRRAVFSASVEQQLRRQGMDMYKDFLDKGKLIPAPILSRAVDDALKTSFSYMPKTRKAGQMGLETMAESGANQIIKVIEQTPFASLAIPFPRFMANAMAFQYRYSPLGALGASEDYMRYLSAVKSGDRDKATTLLRQANTKSAQSLVGIAALAAAYEYRLENQDVEWYEVPNDKGDTTDIRAVFPIAPYMAVADMLVKFKRGIPVKSGDAIQAIVGMKLPAGSQNVFVDKLISLSTSEKAVDDLGVTIGKMVGDFMGRFTQPFVVKNFYDFYDLLKGDEATIARDPNVVDLEDKVSILGVPVNVDAARQRIESRIPGVKEELPEAIPRLREGPIVREGQFFNRLFGFRQDPRKTPVEREVATLDLDPYRLYGSSSGDRDYDRAFIEEANKLVIPRVRGILSNKSYQAKTDIEKRIIITNAIREMTSTARTITGSKYKASDLNKIYVMRFNKLPEDTRMLINQRYARDHNGVTLEEAKDYQALDTYEATIKELKFALGGSVGKLAAKTAIKKAGKKTTKELLQGMQETAAKKTVGAVDDAEIDRLLNKSAAEEPVPAIPEQPEPAPFLAEKPPAMPEETAALPTPEAPQLNEAEATAVSFYGNSTMDFLKKNYPEKYENTIHQFKNSPDPLPFPDKGGIEDFIDVEGNMVFSEEQIAKVKAADEAAAQKQAGVLQEEEPIVVSDKAVKGLIKDVSNIADRDDLIAQIREVRTDRFPKLKEQPQLQGIEDIVIGVTQGDFRIATGREANPTKAKDMGVFAAMAKKNQQRLQDLRAKHKDKPAIELFHGTTKVEGVATGFAKPQLYPMKHMELHFGGPSFTRDLNLQFETGSFGGQDPSLFVSTKIPYAEYEFTKVDMSPKAYKKKDLDVVARTITGDPYTARPLNLPRDGFYETESVFPEADKLMVSRAEETVKKKLSKYAPMEKKILAASNDYKSTLSMWDSMKEADKIKAANKLYKNIRTLFRSYASTGEITSVRTGIGQSYTSRLIGTAVKPEHLKAIAKYLRKQGSTERADLLETLSTKLSNVKEQVDSVNPKDILKLTDKLAKGGLASRR